MNQELLNSWENLKGDTEKCDLMLHIAAVNPSYRLIDVTRVQVVKAEIFLKMGAVQRILFGLADSDDPERSKYLSTGKDYLSRSNSLFSDLLQDDGHKLAIKHRADVLKQMGLFNCLDGKYRDADNNWCTALEIYRDIDSAQNIKNMEHLLDKLSFQLDRVTYINSQLRDLTPIENRERESVVAAFKKFDADNSGFIDPAEFSGLAIKLGTFPPLRDEELSEAMLQLGGSVNKKVSFNELWAWWVADEVKNSLQNNSL